MVLGGAGSCETGIVTKWQQKIKDELKANITNEFSSGLHWIIKKKKSFSNLVHSWTEIYFTMKVFDRLGIVRSQLW